MALPSVVAALLIGLLAVPCRGQLAPQLRRKLGPRLQVALEGGPLAAAAERLIRVRPVAGTSMAHVWIEGTETIPALRAAGADVQTVIPGENLATALVPLAAVPRVASLPGVQRLREAHLVQPSLDVSTSAQTLSSPTRYIGCNARATHSKFEGADIIVGIVDSGIDWDHKDFCLDSATPADSTTRILYLWDQTLTPDADESNPSGFSYGVEYTQAHINAELAGSPTVAVRSRDTDGHGTHVAGIAAGDGSDTDGDLPAGTFKGVAPAASLIVVKTDWTDAGIADGVNYVFQKAAALGKPAVVNLSVGSQYGPHDGTDSGSRAICALTGPGHIVCAAAGNEGDNYIHAEWNGAYPHTFSLSVPSLKQAVGLTFWHHGGDAYTCTVAKGSQSVSATSGTYNSGSIGGATVKIWNATSANSNGDDEVYIEVWNAAPGTWNVTFTRTGTGGNGGIDGWIFYPNDWSVYFSSADRSLEEVITSPADATGYALATPDQTKTVICVGAYISKMSWKADNGNTYGYGSGTLGDLCAFSGVGPNREGSNSSDGLDGWPKPDLAAPGMGIASALSTDVSSPAPGAIAEDGRHYVMAGTSMSCPHVTGTVALMLQASPAAAPADIREALSPLSLGADVDPEVARIWLFRTTRDTDAYADNSWDPAWGFGKMDTDSAFDDSQPTVVRVAGLLTRTRPRGTAVSFAYCGLEPMLEFRVQRCLPSGDYATVATLPFVPGRLRYRAVDGGSRDTTAADYRILGVTPAGTLEVLWPDR
jgi:minor extracellular serine protease Vpr